MPYRKQILEVTSLPSAIIHHQSSFSTKKSLCRPLISSACALVSFLFLAQTNVVFGQPANIQASDIDWISRDQLSPEQEVLLDGHCCGIYQEPPMPTPAADASTTVLGSGVQGDEVGLWTIDSDFEIIQQDLHITADQGEYDQTQGLFSLQDNIRLRQPGLLMTAVSAQFDEVETTSQLYQASYLMHASGIHGTAEIIVYTDAQGIITIDNGLFTRCEPGDNSWMISGENIILDQNTGRGTAKNVTLKVKDLPILYLPWVSFPINDERSSGLLAPVLGSTRDGGLDIATPYYLNLAPNYDATITPRIQTERGVMLGIEGRYLGPRHEQVLGLQFLPNDKLYDPNTLALPNSDSPPTDDRWLLDYRMRGKLAPGWSALVDYAAVSDIDYFQDLGSEGLSSSSQSYLRRNARLRYRNDNWRFTASTQGFQIIDPNVSSLSEPYRKLPALNLRGQYEEDWGLEYGIDADFVMFDRNLNPNNYTQSQIDSGILVTGSRLAITPELSLPWSNSYAFATPSIKYKYATWNLNDNALNTDASPSRGVFSTSMDTGLIFERNINLFGNSLRQTLEPRLFYLYNEYEDQSDIPLFDSSGLTFSYNQLFREDRFSGKDRVGDTNQLTLALSTRVYDDKGQERIKASIGQIQYFADRRVTLRNTPGITENQDTSHLAGELGISLTEHWRAGAYLEWDTHDNEAEVGNFQFQYQSDINHILNLGYRFREAPGAAVISGIKRRIDQTDISGVWPLSDSWGLIGRWNFDLANKRNLESIAGVEYNNCCWTVRVLARQWIDNDALFHGIEENNTGIFIQFELKGLGSVLGGNVNGILNNGISGYRESNYAQ